MNLMRLRVFDEVARAGTFAAAADALSYTPSAVSQQMAKLEAEVGMALMVRTPRGMVPTDAGRALLVRARSILDEVRVAGLELEVLKGLGAGTVRFGSFPTATQTVAIRMLRLFRERCPDVEVVLVDDEPHANVARLHARELDLALVFTTEGRPVGRDYLGQELCPEDAVDLSPLFEDRFVLVVPEGHRLATAPATLMSLRDERLVGSIGTPGLDELAAVAREQGFEPCFTHYRGTDYGAVRALVAAGEGVAVIPGLAASRPFEGTVTRRLEGWSPRRQVTLAKPADGFATPAARAFEAVVRELGGVVGAVAGPAA